MEDRRIKTYFKQQVHAILAENAADADGFLGYFADHEPKDEEILGLLAVSMTLDDDSPLGDWFPTPLEALAALSVSSRAEICRTFRQELKTSLRLHPA